MEVLTRRFPLIIRMVFKNLDNQSITHSKCASRTFAEFLDNERFFWIRVIKKYVDRRLKPSISNNTGLSGQSIR